ncbi:MAG: hypothetical protein ABSA30_01470 [Candidatus Aminicenantales bacterium]|jgi:hypothetical protein
MIDDKRTDETISRLIRSDQQVIPPSVELEILRRSEASKPRRRHPLFSRLLWNLLPSGAVLILGVIFLMRPPQKPSNSDISEIRTQFEIADKNITIVFIQKPDFVFYEEN